MATTGSEQQSPAKRFRLSSGNLTSPTSTANPETISTISRLGSCDMFNAGDSGFSEFTSVASSEDENQTNDVPSIENFPEMETSVENNTSNQVGAVQNDMPRSPSAVSEVSGISGLSDLSNHDWEPNSGTMSWVQQHMLLGTDPRSILTELVPDRAQIPQNLDDVTLWKIIINIMSEPPRRERLRHLNTIQDVTHLLQTCKKILVLTGAGVSVSCGIPDFRSRDGIYARLAVDFPDLPDPQAMFDIHYFRKDPRPFFKFARDLWPGQFTPSKCHKFIRLLEKQNKLLRNYTQNIDTLEQQAGIERVIQCHGSFATATCQNCKHRVPCHDIETQIMEQRIPLCSRCADPSESSGSQDASADLKVTVGNKPIMKPDIVFFGEGMPDEFHNCMALDKEECDLIIVIGSSLKVRPVALIPSALPAHVPQILINREPLRHMVFDVELLGDCDIIVNQLCHMMGSQWTDDVCYQPPLSEIGRLPAAPPAESNDSVASPAPRLVPKKLQIDPSRRDSGLSTGSSESEPVDDTETAKRPEAASEDVTIEALAEWWAPRVKANLADLLPAGSYLYSNPCRYVFPGAELFYEPDDIASESDDSSTSDSSASADEDDSSGIDGDDPLAATNIASTIVADSGETDRGIKRKTTESD